MKTALLGSMLMFSLLASIGCKTAAHHHSSLQSSVPGASADASGVEQGTVEKSDLAWSEQDLPLCFSGRAEQDVFVYSNQQTEVCRDSAWSLVGSTVTAPAQGGRAMIRATAVSAGDSHCPTGGVKIETFFDVNSNGLYDLPAKEGPHDEKFVCNGAAGTTGQSASFISETLKPSTLAGGCPYGGMHYVAFLDMDGKSGKTAGDKILSDTTLCNLIGPPGAKGQDGKDGSAGQAGVDGRSAVIVRLPLAAADKAICTNGGWVYESWTTTVPSARAYVSNRNGNADYAHSVVCSGKPGTDGKPGVDPPKMRWEHIDAGGVDCAGRSGTRLVFSRDKPDGDVPPPLAICDGGQGIQGVRGAQGAKGATGAQGAQGDQGPAGRDGKMLKITTAPFDYSADAHPGKRCDHKLGVDVTTCFVNLPDGACIEGTSATNQVCDGVGFAGDLTAAVDLYGCVSLFFIQTPDQIIRQKCEADSIVWFERNEHVPMYDKEQGFCQTPPTWDEVRDRWTDPSVQSNGTQDVTVNNFRLVTEPITDGTCYGNGGTECVGACTDRPLVGRTRRHHCHYKDTFYFDKITHTYFPTDTTAIDNKIDVAYTEHDYLFPCDAPTGAVPVWTGSKDLGALGSETIAAAVNNDPAGSVLVAGSTTRGLDGNLQTGAIDYFVTKFDRHGVKLWMRQGGVSGQTTQATAVSTDWLGDVFVAGQTSGALFGNTIAASQAMFVTKYDPSGKRLWTSVAVEPVRTWATGVAADATGVVFVTGSTLGGLGGNTLIGTQDAFLMKFDAAGARQWTRHLGVAGTLTAGTSAGVDEAGNAYVAGTSAGGVDGQSLKGKHDAFVVKFDLLGVKQWTTEFGASNADTEALAIGINPIGLVYVGGRTTGGLTKLYETYNEHWTRTGTSDGYIAWINRGGSLVRTEQFGAAGAATSVTGVSVFPPTGDIFVSGRTTGSLGEDSLTGTTDAFVAKFDRGAMSLQWRHQLGVKSREVLANGLATDLTGNAFVVGSSPATIDGNAAKGTRDGFVVKFDGEGVRQ